MQILEAFRALNALTEDTFTLNADGVNELSDFKNNDELEDDITIIDTEAETEDDLQDNYIGKVILDCCVCHSKLYKDKSEVNVDETGELANVGEECPYCYTPDGFKVIGEVTAFNNDDDTGAEDEPIEEFLDANVNLDARGFGGKDNNVSILGGGSPLATESLEKGNFFKLGKKKKATKDKADMKPTAIRPSATLDWDEDIRFASANTDRNDMKEDGTLSESIDDLSLTTNDTHIEVHEDEGGKVTVSAEPTTSNGGETISPVSPETESEIFGDDEMMPDAEFDGSEEEIDVPIDEVDEGSFDESLNSYFRKAYENVNSYRTTGVKSRGNTLIVEGKVRMKDNKVHKTSFILEAKDMTRDGRVRFVGGNRQLTENKKAFTVTGRVRNNKLITESMSYNYRAKNSNGKMSRVYGIARTSNRRK